MKIHQTHSHEIKWPPQTRLSKKPKKSGNPEIQYQPRPLTFRNLKTPYRLKDISTPNFSTSSFDPELIYTRLFNYELFSPGLFNLGLFNHELLNHGVEKFMVEKSWAEKSF